MARSLFEIRIALLQRVLRQNGWDGLLLTRADNFAMATGGKRNYVSTQSDLGACGLYIPAEGRPEYAGNNIEATRIMDEELASPACSAAPFRWFEESPAQWCARRFQGKLVSDDGALGENVHSALAPLRSILLPEECARYRELGRLAAEAMEATLASITTGMPENEISARLIYEGQRRGCLVPVSLIAADDRILRYRHPLPTRPGAANEKRVDRYVMVVAGMVRDGLSVSVTRFRQVQNIDSDTADAYARICAVDACMQEATRPGETLGGVFEACQQAYTRYGFAPDEWHNHHQGGSTGYAARTCKGAPGETFPCLDAAWADALRQALGEDIPFSTAFAWNPSAPGVKSEDTFLLHEDGSQEILTATPALPPVHLAAHLGHPTTVIKSGMAPPDFQA
ncbi:MAG: M24 family metallopeptidase [Candidatus Hydrogenedentes bacterium]|nr:M24 family metallopeptidase [Candidatus Hydrogenedentota bacterium]